MPVYSDLKGPDKSGNLQILKSSNLQIFKSSNPQIFKSSNLLQSAIVSPCVFPKKAIGLGLQTELNFHGNIYLF